MAQQARFVIGQVVHHNRFGYRGVIVDVDPVFNGTEEWYQEMARSRPPRDMPWYHVLVDGSMKQTYVAERHLDADASGKPVAHPLIKVVFDGQDEQGGYRLKRVTH